MKLYTVNDYCKEHFGKKLYKLSLDGGFTCPTRDSTLGTGGCIFCSSSGSGDFAEKYCSLDEQIERAKKRVCQKNKNGGYIAYFQSFTGTYAPVKRLYELFYPTITRPDIDVLSVATRPDCLEDEKIALLSELNKIKPVWVELGFQTSKQQSVQFIRRGFENEVFADAVSRLKSHGIYVIAHMIIGLPGEDINDMKNTLNYITKTGCDGIKLQLLHVLSDSDLAALWQKGEIKTLSKAEYLSCLKQLLPLIKPNMAVHRLTGDGNKKYLLAPLWSANKKDVLNSINRMLEEIN